MSVEVPEIYRIAVRQLCEFTAKRGSLDIRFTPAPTAQEGIAGHTLLASRRGSSYRRELNLQGRFEVLQVRGRADGFDADANRLEEFKTFRGDLDRMPDNHRSLHWAQLKMYGAMVCRERGLREINLALVYLDLSTQKETVLDECVAAEVLSDFFDEQCRIFLSWARQELAHRRARDAALDALRFPFKEFRKGQRQLSAAVYRTAKSETSLMMQASTGMGKTMATLFAALKAGPGQRLDKVFFLCAKTSGREPALDALQRLDPAHSLPLRAVELVAREKACEYPGRNCDAAQCPLAAGFYDRLPAARADAFAGEADANRVLDQTTVREVARRHQVCPYYLSQELVRWADVVIGDYNYYFDSSALLWALSSAHEWRVALLVDEAHNLVERARAMYSAQLQPQALMAALKSARTQVKSDLHRIRRAWERIEERQTAEYQAHDEVPEDLLKALQGATTSMTDHMAQTGTSLEPDLLRFYFDALQFTRLADSDGPHSLFDVVRTAGEPGADRIMPRTLLTLRNLVPAPYLKPRFAAAAMSVLFSATLAPAGFYRDVLGLPENTDWRDIESPFDANQLTVRISRKISTRYRDRAGSLAAIVALMRDQYAERPGNYLAFFSSFEYLRAAHRAFSDLAPGIPAWAQTQAMRESERSAFLERFTNAGCGVGFAVLGGPFSEGIDLPLDRLIGAFIATLGMPPLNAVNAEFERRMQMLFGSGYEYTYLYPGLQKVVQAAGRVIRTPADRGVVHLMDERFARQEVRALLPKWWCMDHRAEAHR